MAKIIVALLMCCVVLVVFDLPGQCDARFIKRSYEPSICSKSTPCGWEVYTPTNRVVEFFINSPCVCAEGHDCRRWSDDISISAYVFRCMAPNNIDTNGI